MKKIFLFAILVSLLGSCKKWLDVNNNPSSPNATVPTAEQRLPPLIAQFADAYESAGTRAAFLSQQLAVTYANNNNWNLTRWNSNASSAGWPWQCWYVNAAVNITPLITAAEKVEAYHYIGVAKIMKAWGFGTLSDFYGMMPYDEFDNPAIMTPRFDDGSHIQEKILVLLDEAIADLRKTQGPAAPSLAKGDILNNGNVDTWIRLAYGLKARYLNHLTKKSTYNSQAILEALANAPQTTSQSSIMQYIDELKSDGTPNPSASKEALQYTNTGTTARLTKLYIDYLTNNYTGAPTGSNNMEDPRANLIIPQYQNVTGNLVRSQGVDMTSELPKSGPSSYTYNASTKKFTGDSMYVVLRKTPASPSATDRILSTGCWYTKRNAKGLLLTNAEMKFIEAEVKFRTGDLEGALTAYKSGIRAHMELLGINSAAIESFLSSTSVTQTSADLTLSNIMIQKYIVLSFSPELWVDLRRMNYCADPSGNYNETLGIYKGFKRPSHCFTDAYPNPTDWPRRFAVASYEINFNVNKVLEADPSTASPSYISKPVWWDKP